MTFQRAVKLAVECIEKELQSLAVDANLADKYEADYPRALMASKKRNELKEAIKTLTMPRMF